MRTNPPTPFRGLVVGFLALIAFASGAVAMTAGGSTTDSSDSAQATAAQTMADATSGETHEGHHHGDHARLSASREAGDGGRDGGQSWSLGGPRRR